MSEAHTGQNGKGNLVYTLGIVVAAALGGFLFGFDTAVINGAVPVLREMFANPETGFAGGLATTAEATDTFVGLAVAMALAGAALGAFTAGPVADRIGRKRSMLIAAVLFLASAIGSGLPVTIWDFTFWRILGGIAFGGASVLAPAYIAEVSPAKVRGRLGSLQQLAIVIGIFIALVSNLVIARIAGGAEADFAGAKAWKWMFWIEAFPAAIYGILSLIIPESPRYLVVRNRDSDARRVLEKVLGREAAEGKIAEIHESLAKDQHRPRMSDILAKGKGFLFLPIVWLGIGLSIFQQFVGINVVFYYSNLLWESVGLSEDQAFLNTAIGGTTNVATTFIAIALVDKLGRKPLLLGGSAGMTVALAIMAFVLGTSGLKTKAVDLTPPADYSGTVEVTVTSVHERDTMLKEGGIERSSDTMSLTIESGRIVEAGAPASGSGANGSGASGEGAPAEDDGVAASEFDFSEAVARPRDLTRVEIAGLPRGSTLAGTEANEAGVFVLEAPDVQPDLRGNRGVVALVALNLFIVAFGFSWGPIVWVMLGEMFSNQIRGAGLAVAAAAQWAANFLITMTFPIMASELGLGFAYGFYAVAALISLVFVLGLIPETKGRELEQMGQFEQGR